MTTWTNCEHEDDCTACNPEIEYDVETRDEIDDLLESAQDKLNDALELLERAARKSEDAGLTVHGQLRAYTIPWIETWKEDRDGYQPGAIDRLRRELNEEEDER
jgi:hypothetical protein